MKTSKLVFNTISMFLLSTVIVFSACSKKNDVVVAAPAATDLTVNFVGAFTGTYTNANGDVTLAQKAKVTRLSDTQIRVENNGGPLNMPTVTFTLKVGAVTPGTIGGNTTDGSTIASTPGSIAVGYSDGAAYAGNK
jgi:hypothetical protein